MNAISNAIPLPHFDPEFAAPSEWAEMYRALGLQVVPAKSYIESPQSWKRPALPNWQQLQNELAPDSTFARWYGQDGEHFRRNNMGLLTGRCSGGAFVVDLDFHSKPDALLWWQRLLAEHNYNGELETVRQTTGGGGAQLLFRAPTGWTPPTIKTALGVDIRGKGGFAMLPPSMHQSGTPYRWDDGCEPWAIEIADAPQWLCEEIDRLAQEQSGGSSLGLIEHTASAAITSDAFGFTVEGREEKMRNMVWARLVDLARECPIRPDAAKLAEELEDLLAHYLRTTKTRVAGAENVAGLECEGRGPTAFREHWHRALKKWDTDIIKASLTPVHPSNSEGAGGVVKSFSAEIAPTSAHPTVRLLRGSEITPEAVTWLWPGYLAQGKMHVLAGAPGGGKTTIALRLAAIVSTGGAWPGGGYCPVGNVVIWSGEDDIKDTLVPRLIAAGADMSRVHFVGDVRDAGGLRSFDPSKDVPALQAAIQSAGGASLLIVDPIVSAIAGDGHKSNDVRRGLQPLVDLAMQARCALFGITHFSKGTSGRDPLERVTGSVSFGAPARVVFVAAKEQQADMESDAPPRRMFLRCKSNIGSDSGGFEYNLEQQALEGFADMLASVATFGLTVEGDTRTILTDAETEPGDGDGGALAEAKEWLLDCLLDGPKPHKAILKAATNEGHSKTTLKRAKKALGVVSRKSSLNGGWEWFYPGAMTPTREGDQESRSGSAFRV